jgi:hypothetical protein
MLHKKKLTDSIKKEGFLCWHIYTACKCSQKAIAQSKNTSSEWLIDSPPLLSNEPLAVNQLDWVIGPGVELYYSLIFYNLSLMFLGGSWERFK